LTAMRAVEEPLVKNEVVKVSKKVKFWVQNEEIVKFCNNGFLVKAMELRWWNNVRSEC
jgi:hypothetical protein